MALSCFLRMPGPSPRKQAAQPSLAAHAEVCGGPSLSCPCIGGGPPPPSRPPARPQARSSRRCCTPSSRPTATSRAWTRGASATSSGRSSSWTWRPTPHASARSSSSASRRSSPSCCRSPARRCAQAGHTPTFSFLGEGAEQLPPAPSPPAAGRSLIQAGRREASLLFPHSLTTPPSLLLLSCPLGLLAAQGLANLLWAYAKLPEPPVDVMSVILAQMTEMIAKDQSKMLFDAQVCSCRNGWVLLCVGPEHAVHVVCAAAAGAAAGTALACLGRQYMPSRLLPQPC